MQTSILCVISLQNSQGRTQSSQFCSLLQQHQIRLWPVLCRAAAALTIQPQEMNCTSLRSISQAGHALCEFNKSSPIYPLSFASALHSRLVHTARAQTPGTTWWTLDWQTVATVTVETVSQSRSMDPSSIHHAMDGRSNENVDMWKERPSLVYS